MPQVYSLRAPENFNYTDGHHSPAGRSHDNQHDDDAQRGMPSSSLKSTDYLQVPSSPMFHNSNPRVTTAAVNKKRRSPIIKREKSPSSYIDVPDRITPDYNRRLPTPNISSRHRVTTYTITSPIDDPIPSPISQYQRKPLVSFDRVTYHNGYDVLEEVHDSPRGISYIPLSQSKALQSIERSMNMFRFRRY